MAGSVATRAFEEHAWVFRRMINDAYAGPRLSAAIRAAQIFMPPAFWSTYQGSNRELLPYYAAELAALRDRDPDAARAACIGRSEVMGRIMLAELVRRRVLGPGSNTHAPPSTL
jgi:DNA-binding GntR family transcriptional regulator